MKLDLAKLAVSLLGEAKTDNKPSMQTVLRKVCFGENVEDITVEQIEEVINNFDQVVDAMFGLSARQMIKQCEAARPVVCKSARRRRLL